MDNIDFTTFNDYFYKIYKKNGYLDKYGGSVIATTLFLLSFFPNLILLLCHVKNGSYKAKLGG